MTDFKSDWRDNPEIPVIADIDDMLVGESYTFDPPLPICEVSFLSKHSLGGSGRSRYQGRPNFLKDDIKLKGLVSGKLITKSPQPDGKVIGIFGDQQCRFYNETTDATEVARYTVNVRFSKESAEGIEVNIERIIKETNDASDGIL